MNMESRKLPSPLALLIVCTLVMVAFWGKFAVDAPLIFGLDYVERLIVIAIVVIWGGFRLRTRAPWIARDILLSAIIIAVADLLLFHIAYRIAPALPSRGTSALRFRASKIRSSWFSISAQACFWWRFQRN